MLLWVINFYRLRNLKEIASRRPKSSFLAGILCVIGNMIVFPAALLYLNNPKAPHIPFIGSFIHLGLMLSILGPYHIFTFRAYMVYFDIKFNAILEDREWRLYIDPDETNWFLKHRHTFGNERRIALVTFIHWAVFTLLVLAEVISHGHRGTELSRYLIGIPALDTMFIDIYLYFKFPKFNDIWGIHNEIKLTLRVELIQQTIYYIGGLIFGLTYYTMTYVYAFVLVGATIFVFVLIIHWRVFRIFALPSMPCVDVPWDRSASRFNELCDDNQVQNEITVARILQDKHGFNAFARHLTREFSIESLLFFVETHQWKQSLRTKDGYSCLEMSRMMDIVLPENSPKSRIIQNRKQSVIDMEMDSKQDNNDNNDNNKDDEPSTEEYIQAIRLFKKYITVSAYFAVNISSAARCAMYAEFGYSDSEQINENEMILILKEKKKMNKKTLFHLFDESRSEIYRLLKYAFFRFRQSDAFVKLSQNISVLPSK